MYTKGNKLYKYGIKEAYFTAPEFIESIAYRYDGSIYIIVRHEFGYKTYLLVDKKDKKKVYQIEAFDNLVQIDHIYDYTYHQYNMKVKGYINYGLGIDGEIYFLDDNAFNKMKKWKLIKQDGVEGISKIVRDYDEIFFIRP